MKTEDCAAVCHSKDYLCLGRECGVDRRYADIAITVMLVKNQELHRLKKGQRESSRRAEPIFVSAFAI